MKINETVKHWATALFVFGVAVSSAFGFNQARIDREQQVYVACGEGNERRAQIKDAFDVLVSVALANPDPTRVDTIERQIARDKAINELQDQLDKALPSDTDCHALKPDLLP